MRDELALLRRVCRVIIDVAGYRMAWAGYAESDARKTIRPIVCEGHDEGYVETIEATWSADDQRGRGPAGSAVRTGEAVVVRSIEEEDRLEPWRKDALARGYRSLVAQRFANPEAPELREPHQNPWLTRDKRERLIEWRCTTLPEEVTGKVSVLGLGVDVTDQQRAEEELMRLMSHDLLTGMANRTLACNRLEHAIALARRRNDKVGVLQLDLDEFKDVVDSLDLTTGDELLKEIGKRLLRTAKSEDTVARMGGDEYCVIAERVLSTDELHTLAQQVMSVFESPFIIEGREICISTSMGISVYPDDASTVAALLKHADTALHRAKQEGRDRYVFFTADMNEKAAQRLSLMGALRQALRRDEYELHYQPLVELNTGRIVAAEALGRHPVLRMAAGVVVQPDLRRLRGGPPAWGIFGLHVCRACA